MVLFSGQFIESRQGASFLDYPPPPTLIIGWQVCSEKCTSSFRNTSILGLATPLFTLGREFVIGPDTFPEKTENAILVVNLSMCCIWGTANYYLRYIFRSIFNLVEQCPWCSNNDLPCILAEQKQNQNLGKEILLLCPRVLPRLSRLRARALTICQR